MHPRVVKCPVASTNSVTDGMMNKVARQNAHFRVIVPTERHTPAKPAAVIVQIRYPRLDHTSVHPRRRHVALQKETDAGAAVECPAGDVAGIGILAVVDGRVGDGAPGDDGRVPHVEGVPEGADEVDGDGETGVGGIAKGDVATAVDA